MKWIIITCFELFVVRYTLKYHYLQVLEFIFQIQLESDTPTMSYYQPMLLELFRCLCNNELSFIQKTAGDFMFIVVL